MSDAVELDKRHVWHPFTQMRNWEASDPLVIERAEGCYLIDQDGRRYLDGTASLWVNVHGHNREELNAAIVTQLGKVAHSTLLGLTNAPAAHLAAELAKRLPGSLNRVFYSDSGSTAVEIALKQAFQYWSLQGKSEKCRFIYLDHGYHGDTLGAVGVGGIPVFHATFGPLIQPGIRVMSPAPCRSRPRLSNEEARTSALDDLRAKLERHGEETAAMIVEPLVQGAAGMWTHPEGYLAAAADLCRKYDVLLVVDEVATGFGRTGRMFACEHEDVEPDFICLAKGITGGYLPLAATVARDEIYEAFLGEVDRTFFHGHTYTGNALACAVALASLELFDREGTVARVAEQSSFFGETLEAELGGRSVVLESRQCGFMVGVELVEDSASGRPFHVEQSAGRRVCETARRHGVIIRNLGDVVVLMPPLVASPEELTELVKGLAAALDSTL